MTAWAIQGHPRSKYRHFKQVLSYEEGAQIPSRILKIGQYEIQKTIPLRYMGLEGRQITGFQLKIRNPWRYKVWPKTVPYGISSGFLEFENSQNSKTQNSSSGKMALFFQNSRVCF